MDKLNEVKNLNLGSGKKKIDGYVNMDILEWDGNTDIVHDLTDIPYPFDTGQIENVYCCETLEHLSLKDLPEVLNEIYRIMAKDGKLGIQVPDCGKMMEYYVNGEICRCVNHKDTGEGFRADPNCTECKGKAKVNPVRWVYAFTGAGKHKYDYHLNFFTKRILEEYLRGARFHKFEYKDDINKIKASCCK